MIILKRSLLSVYLWLQKILLRYNVFISVLRPSRNLEIIEVLKKLRAVPSQIAFQRIGGDEDGGYVLPILERNYDFCLSPGVGPVSSLEEHLEKIGIPVLMLDASVDGPAAPLDQSVFIKKFLGVVDNNEVITLASSLKLLRQQFRLGTDARGLLQMDIEGSEYSCLLSSSKEILESFSVISIELHGLDKVVLPEFRRILDDTMSKLLDTHEVVHLHANNCCGTVKIGGLSLPRVLEMTLLLKTSMETDFKKGVTTTTGPGRAHDARCVSSKTEIFLNEWWFSKANAPHD